MGLPVSLCLNVCVKGHLQLTSISRVNTDNRLPPRPHGPHRHSHRPPLSPASGLFLIITYHSQHLPYIPLLQIIPTKLRSLASRSRRHNSNCKYSRSSTVRSPRRLFRNLRKSRWRVIPLLEQRDGVSYTGVGGSGSIEPDMGSIDVQR